MDLAGLRRDYIKNKLTKKHVDNDPIVQFEKWLKEAIDCEVMEPTAMIVATADNHGQPTTRNVLLKGIENGGFVFYTNYNSTKGRNLEVNNKISATFYWPELERQVHISGEATKTGAETSDTYFKQRPRNSQIGARISPQSAPINSRTYIMREFVKEAAKWIGREVQRPDFWGGYTIKPLRIEFWQGRANRLHDRIEYTWQDGAWKLQRLAP